MIPQEFSRAELVSLIDQNYDVLEIGPFTNPVCRGNRVRYFDVLSRNGLVERAIKVGYPSGSAVDIDYVSPNGDLSVVNDKFDICISSHCIEHQADLIAHLDQIDRLLKVGGRYFLIIPDKRYCFDHFISESTIADILDARGRTTHTLRSVIEHRTLTTHNDPSRHWRSDHGTQAAYFDVNVVKKALVEYADAKGGYIDVHAWQFTPASFRNNLNALAGLGLTKLHVETVYHTPFGSFEFCAILKKS
ncbi:MAG: methyltransferase domain-containing protein [Phyllobacterium sp.]